MRLLIITLLIIPSLLKAQLENKVLQSEYDLRKGQIYDDQFILGTMAYLKNNEYFNLIHPGETFFGVQVDANYIFNTTLGNKFKLTTGILAQQDFGDDKILSKFLPKFTINYTYRKAEMQVGAIKSHVNHGMHDAMLNYEQALTHPVEYGGSFKYKQKAFTYHNWLDWRNLANIQTKKQEEIVFGQNLEFKVNQRRKFSFRFPIQNLIYHKGGQGINNPIVTRVNGMAGVEFETLNKKLILGYRIFGAVDNSPQIQQAFSQGFAHYSSVSSKIKNHSMHLGYWYANQYTNTLGNPIFSNVNVDYPYANQQIRQLVSLRYNYARNVRNKAIIDFRFEPYYNLHTGDFFHSASLFLRVFWM